MLAVSPQDMKADEFLAWAEAQEGRWELHGGKVISMSPERYAHYKIKGFVFLALTRAIERAGSNCEAFTDGPSVRIDSRTVFEPDALVRRLAPIAGDGVEIGDPTIVVEVLSPKTAGRDYGVKLSGYFSLSSVMHYLVVSPEERMAIHYKRAQGDVIETRILRDGLLRLDPPGLEVPLSELFPTV
jgi:Uma2 family endonuclease